MNAIPYFPSLYLIKRTDINMYKIVRKKELNAVVGAVETMRLQQPTEFTPSASRSLSSSLREGAKGTSCQRAG